MPYLAEVSLVPRISPAKVVARQLRAQGEKRRTIFFVSKQSVVGRACYGRLAVFFFLRFLLIARTTDGLPTGLLDGATNRRR